MRGLAFLLTLAAALTARAKIVTESVPYKDGEVALEGFLFYDDAKSGKQPAVLVVHEWWGLNEFAKSKARALAELGYVAFAVDMYGKGKVTDDPNVAGQLYGQFRGNMPLLRQRFKAALDLIAKHERVDPKRIAAIGFCFGGLTVLNAAAGGLDLACVVSFHGSLPPISEADARDIKAKILVLHGAADTLVPDEAVKAFQDTLRKTSVDWQMIIYGGAKHGFMNPDCDKLHMDGVGYFPLAATRAWKQMQTFFDETLGPVH